MDEKKFIKKRTAILAISYLSAAVLVLAVLFGVSHERARRYELYAANNCQHAFDELVTAVGELDAALQKSVYATSPEMMGAVCTEIFGKAMTAQMSLGVLPFSTQELERTSGFISRVGDYAFSLSRNAARGQGYTQEEIENLRSLSDTAGVLAQNLKGMQTDMSLGVISMDELYAAERRLDETEDAAVPATVGGSMRLIEKEFPETPTLIYDGPFSEHIVSGSHKALEGLEMVDENRAREVAADFLAVPKTRVYPLGESAGDIPSWNFAYDADGATTTVAVTKEGGKVLGMLSSRPVGERKVSPEAALEKAKSFLRAKGYANMAETYSMCQGNILTANFAFVQEGVRCYSDLVKVSVAMDTGKVCAFEAKGYLSSHYWRDLPEKAVSEETAREKVSPLLTVLSARTALVPSDGKYETLCYEFTCQAEDERKYLIYVDAVSGEQEKILILLEDENGTLTL
ncbi:MAG: germination protein YpeB [Oscillospiraceae bacterium]